MGTITICWGIVCKRTRTKKRTSFVRDLNRANEYAAKAETIIGKKVAGIVTSKELNMAPLSGTPALCPVQASAKLLRFKWKGWRFHHPNCTSLKGRIDAIKTPKMGISQIVAITQATTCTSRVNGVILGLFEGSLILLRNE
jgi:hypothetical protein